MNLAYELRVGVDHKRLVLHGEIDLSVRDEFHAALQHAVGLSGGTTEVDLRDVTFLDCSGIGALAAASNTARHRHRAVVLSHARGGVRHVLELTRFLPHLGTSFAPDGTRVIAATD